MSPDRAMEYVDENTIGVFVILGKSTQVDASSMLTYIVVQAQPILATMRTSKG